MLRQIRGASPRGESHSLSTTAEDRESEDENQYLCAAVHSSGDQVVVLDEQLRVLLADVELGSEPQ